MAGDAIIAVIGNLTADPEMRFTPSGAAVASFTVASTPRVFDRRADGWKDGETLFIRCSTWRDAAENVAGSLTEGTRVIVRDRLVQRPYAAREGESHMIVEMQIGETGPSLRYTKAQVTRQPRGDGQGGFGDDQSGPQGGGFGGNQSGQGGYNQGGPQQGGYNGGGGSDDQDQSGYDALADGTADDPWATDDSTSFSDEPPF